MAPTLSLSTCWCSHRHTDGYALVREMVDLGFESIELSHGVRISLVPGILRAVEEKVVRVSSVHNFCPLPPGVMNAAPNLYEPSAKDRRERTLWLSQTRKTLEFAARVGAGVVVLHSGSVRFFFTQPWRAWERYLEEREATTPLAEDQAYRKILDRVAARLRARQERFLENLRESLREIIPLARQLGLRLGLENREAIQELPRDDEMPGLLASLEAPDVVGYWHDTGHAQLKQDALLITQERLLRENEAHLLGFHLHDVSPDGRDHQAIGSGVIDWPALRPFLQPPRRFVFEASPRLGPEEVLAGRAFFEKLVAAPRQTP